MRFFIVNLLLTFIFLPAAHAEQERMAGFLYRDQNSTTDQMRLRMRSGAARLMSERLEKGSTRFSAIDCAEREELTGVLVKQKELRLSCDLYFTHNGLERLAELNEFTEKVTGEFQLPSATGAASVTITEEGTSFHVSMRGESIEEVYNMLLKTHTPEKVEDLLYPQVITETMICGRRIFYTGGFKQSKSVPRRGFFCSFSIDADGNVIPAIK